MAQRDPRIDAYIEKSADFAKPVLRHIRDVVHDACPDVEETMRWSFPHFDYRGIMVSMAAFKQHCTLGFWNAREVIGPDAREGAMGQFGRIGSVKDLPSKKVLAGYIKKAMTLNDAGAKPQRVAKPGRVAQAKVPDEAKGRTPGPGVSPRP